MKSVLTLVAALAFTTVAFADGEKMPNENAAPQAMENAETKEMPAQAKKGKKAKKAKKDMMTEKKMDGHGHAHPESTTTESAPASTH